MLSEAEFLQQYDPGDFERPSVAVDVVVMTVCEGVLQVALIRRDQHPHMGRYMLPGGFVGIDEDILAAANRVLRDKAGVSNIFLEQLYTFGGPGRDPRMRVITVAHVALVPCGVLETVATYPVQVDWDGEDGGPAMAVQDGESLPMAFDHADILGVAVKRLRGRLSYSPVAYSLLPETFTLRALQEVHEAICGHRLNKPSFRRRVLASGELVPTGEREESRAHRPAELYRFALGD